MPSKLSDILAYFVRHYPEDRKFDLTVSRLRNMLFLADWRSVITSGHPVSEVHWWLTPFGPAGREVDEALRKRRDRFALKEFVSASGRLRDVVCAARDLSDSEAIDNAAKTTLQYVIDATSSLEYDSFIHFLYSTYPILKAEPDHPINLDALAQEYKVERATIPASLA